MQQRITVLASPEEALIVNTDVETYAMIDAITAIHERTEAICDLLVGGIQGSFIKHCLLCSVTWQLQANMDCLTLFIQQYLTTQQPLCTSLINAARKKASDIIMCYGITDKAINSEEAAIEPLLAIKYYMNAVLAIAYYQDKSDTNILA